MSFEFRADEALRESIHRIAGKEIEKIRDYASGSIGRSRDEMVHEIRKSLTKLRTILRLVRPAIDEKSIGGKTPHFATSRGPSPMCGMPGILVEALDKTAKTPADRSHKDGRSGTGRS